MALIAKVAVEGLLYSFDRIFDYLLSGETAAARAGCRVFVNFGSSAKRSVAMVFEVTEAEPEAVLKPVLSLIDRQPLLSDEQLKLALWIAERTFCPIFESVKLMIPSGLGYLDRIKYRLGENIPASAEETAVTEYLANGAKSAESIRRATGADAALLERMEHDGFIESDSTQVRKVGDKTVKMLSLATSPPEIPKGRITPKQKAVLDYLRENGESAAKTVTYQTGSRAAVFNTLISKGLVRCTEQLSYRDSYIASDAVDPDNFTLNPGQKAAFDTLCGVAKGGQALLYGVTGSGKTMVALKLVQKTLSEGRSAILMVPEILLTPQFTRLFTSCFGRRVAVLHSGLSGGVRLDEYRRIKAGEADVVIGTRSAVFAPLENIGLITMDEESDGAYKSESSPRYDAGEVAAVRARAHGALFLRMSATPSVKTFYNAVSGKNTLVRLGSRFAGAELPKVKIVDMRDEPPVIPGGVLGQTLLDKLTQNHKDGHQSVLLLNRRGHDTIVICYDCGEVIKCPNCSAALNYHSANGRLMCHLCGYSRPDAVCGKCGSEKMRYLGSGIQKVGSELEQLLPDAKVLRMDTDTAVTREAHDQLFDKFGGGDYDILIGTQMVAKGLDFENVTLAGVLNSEQGLFSGDFKGPERTFSLLTQVVGRCGRGRYSGEAVIQTYLPEHRIFEYAQCQDYDSFYADEIELRRGLLQPPFCDVCLIGVSSPVLKAAAAGAKELAEAFTASIEGTDIPIRIYGPAPAQTARVANRYRFRLTLKCRADARFRAIVSSHLREFSKRHARDDVKAFADINPDQFF